jgi:hypothetical protein
MHVGGDFFLLGFGALSEGGRGPVGGGGEEHAMATILDCQIHIFLGESYNILCNSNVIFMKLIKNDSNTTNFKFGI